MQADADADHARADRCGQEKLVVIGASHGGIEAMSALLRELPKDFPVPIIFILHKSPTHRSLLAQVLDIGANLDVVPVTDGAMPTAPRVYVSIPGKNVQLTPRGISLQPIRKSDRFRPSINLTLRSAASVYGANLTAVLLSGMLDDGVEGLLDVYETGGTTIVQDPLEAKAPSMPLQAIIRDHPDIVAPVSGIAARLIDGIGDKTTRTPAPAEVT